MMEKLLTALSWLVYVITAGIGWVFLAFGLLILRETFGRTEE